MMAGCPFLKATKDAQDSIDIAVFHARRDLFYSYNHLNSALHSIERAIEYCNSAIKEESNGS